MEIVVIILKNESLLERIASIFIECELFDTTILDGEGVETIASETSEIFNEIQRFFGNTMNYHRTIISAVPDKESISELISLFKEENIDFTDGNTGIIMAFPCTFYLGGGNNK